MLSPRSGLCEFSVPLRPDQYNVPTVGSVKDSIVYGAFVSPTFTVKKGATLQVSAQRGARMDVRGFPKFLAFGAWEGGSGPDERAQIEARTQSIFGYAGIDRGGDLDKHLRDDAATRQTIDGANLIQAKLKSETPMPPILVSFTCALAVGDARSRLADEVRHRHGFHNLVVALSIAKEKASSPKSSRDVPACFIISPDFLGECQKENIKPTYSMPVRAPLEQALAHRKMDLVVPDNIEITLRGYVAAVNWLFLAVVKDVMLGGWSTSGVWGNSSWVYERDPQAPFDMATKTVAYINSLRLYTGDYVPHSLAIDRFQADDSTLRGYGSGYCYGPVERTRFVFCTNLSLKLQTPIIPFQIPASRIPNRNEIVMDLESEHIHLR